MLNAKRETRGGTGKTPAVIPLPMFMEVGMGRFILNANTVVVAEKALAAVAAHLTAFLQPACGFNLRIIAEPDGRQENAIFLSLAKGMGDLGQEGYCLEITPQRIAISAPAPAGIFYGIQTLRQLLPPAIFSAQPVKDIVWEVPCAKITDRPRFAWRGLMLDTGHDFQRLPFILRFIDLMAMHKFNVFHWHITDLGTFPLEIKGYPKLQDPATLGTRQRGEPPRGVKAGRYTQEEARQIVQYAAARHIAVVPEIDMPGHSTPALIAYPEFDCPV
ncbi:MAG: family 20 glycosylhydrolase, partial [Planctomycetota bacterium]|nr:family 20 glycosylhydrolase [Planctomycetota bacterium]